MSHEPQSKGIDNFNKINAVLTLILTATIGYATITLSNKQFDLEQRRAHYELYTRREKVFYAMRDFTRYAGLIKDPILEPFDDKKYDEFTNRFADFKRETAVAPFLFNKDVEEFRLKIFADGVDMSAIVFSLATIAKSTEMTKEQKENEEIKLVRKLAPLKANMLLYLDECTDVFRNYLSLSETNNL